MSSKRGILWIVLAYVALVFAWIFLTGPLAVSLFPASPPETVRLIATIAFVMVSAALLFAALLMQAGSMQSLRAAHREADEEAERQLARLEALADSLSHASSTAGLTVALEFICKEAVATLGAEAATIVGYSPQRRTLELLASYGLSEDFHQGFRPVPALAHQDLATQPGPRLVSLGEDKPAGIPHPDLYRKAGLGGLVCLPVSCSGEFVGLLTIGVHGARSELATREGTLLKAFGDLAALAVGKDHLQAGVQQALAKLDVLRTGDLAILSSLDLQLTLRVFLQQTINVLQVDAVDVLMLNPGAQALEYAASLGFQTGRIKDARVPLGEGFAGKIALERRSMYIPDVMQERPFTRRELIEGEGLVTYFGVPLVSKGQVQGVLEVYHREPFHASDGWLSFLETLAGQAAIAIDNASLFSSLQKTNLDLTVAYDRTLEGWSRALDLRDNETEGHTRRVTDLSLKLARDFNLGDEMLMQMQRGALLHDIGKMGIPDSILLKPAELTKEEWKIMRLHPVHAFDMLSPISYLRSALDIPYCHHEKWDGSGYPRGLKGDAIPLPARLFAAVDVWDALTSDRPYRAAWPNEKAFQYIRAQAGRHFDPQVSDSFLRMMTGGGKS